MKVLIIGGGGREHALAWKAARSRLVERVYVAPGNAGTAAEPRVRNIAIAADDLANLADFAAEQRVGLTIVGPETPLVMGVVDLFEQRNLRCFGPRRAAARLEGSKTFAKDFLRRHAIPTADYAAFTDADAAIAYVNARATARAGAGVNEHADDALVIKADGLAAGKGVVIARSRAQAHAAITAMLTERRHGDAGRRVVIEEFLAGEEASFICMVDGEAILPMASSQDHKAARDGDAGPNTGGMGAYSPAAVIDDALHARILREIIEPTARGLAAEGMRYTGFLYAGLMIGADGAPRVLEFNCRFGDPETQPILLRMRSDLVAHCVAALDGALDLERARWDRRRAVGVVMASAGYPGDYEKGSPIRGLERAGEVENESKVFHAGTAIANGEVVATGGRV
ncbi:MAG: phosphoribosylamine--glycine ligase, partial [bacterium]